MSLVTILSRLTSIARFVQVGLSLSPLDPMLPCLDSILALQFRELQSRWFLLDTFFFRHSFWGFRQPLWHTTLGLRRPDRWMRSQSSLSFHKCFFFLFLPVTVTFASLAFLEACCRLKAEDGELGDSWESPLCWDILSSDSGNESSLWNKTEYSQDYWVVLIVL